MPILKESKVFQPLWRDWDEKANKSGLRNTVYSVNGDQYAGEWAANKKDGKGTYKWKSNGAMYDGDWKDGMRCGFGTYSMLKSDGSQQKVYAGGWKNDQRHGYGTHYSGPDEFYEGEWYNDERSGWGRIYYADGSQYEGEWLQDKRHGQGLLRLANEDRYEGKWKDNMKHGEGKFFYMAKSQLFEGVWRHDIPKCGELKDYPAEGMSPPPEFARGPAGPPVELNPIAEDLLAQLTAHCVVEPAAICSADDDEIAALERDAREFSQNLGSETDRERSTCGRPAVSDLTQQALQNRAENEVFFIPEVTLRDKEAVLEAARVEFLDPE